MISRPVSAKRFVGRVRERAFFDERLEAAERGEGSIVLLFGDAGIGKTRLLRERFAAAKPRGFNEAWARNLMHASAAFAPLSEAFGEIVAAAPRATPAVTSARQLFERFLGAFDDADKGEGDWQKRRLFVVAGDVLARAAQIRPVLLVIDDAQWADPESLELLQYLASRVERERVVLVIAAREEARRGSGVFPDAVIAFERNSWCYRAILGELNDAETRELIFGALGVGQTLTQRAVLEIVQRSGGNPLFAEALVRDALEHGGDASGLPASVEQSVRRRLDQFAPDDAASIEVAAAIGATFDEALFREIAGLGTADAQRVLRLAAELGLVEVDPIGAGTRRFRHQLTRDAIYGRLLPDRRRDIHARVATALEQSGASAAELSLHWEHAGYAAKAAEYAERAGDDAVRRYAYASARDHFEAALRLGAFEQAHEAIILEKLAEAHNWLGAPEAYERYARALAYYREQRDEPAIVRLSVRMSVSAWNLGKSDDALGHVREALDLATADDPLRFSAGARGAHLLASQHNGEAALKLAEEADAYRGERPAEDAARLLLARAMSLFQLRRFDEHRAGIDPALEEADKLSDKRQLVVALINLGGYARELCEFERAARMFARAMENADENGLILFSAYSRVGGADVAYLRGDLSRAHELISAASALAVESDLVRLFASFTGIPIALAVDDASLAERLADDRLLEAAANMEPRYYVALLAAHAILAGARNDTTRAAALIGRILDLRAPFAASTDLGTIAQLAADADLPRVVALLADGDVLPLGRLNHALGLATIAARRDPQAARKPLFAEAIALAREHNMLLFEAAALEGAGDIADAIAIYRRCGAIRAVERLEHAKGKRAADGELTRREREISQLVAAGHSNRRIADILSISERTAEHHIASIFSKLAIHSRVELVARIAAERNAGDGNPIS